MASGTQPETESEVPESEDIDSKPETEESESEPAGEADVDGDFVNGDSMDATDGDGVAAEDEQVDIDA